MSAYDGWDESEADQLSGRCLTGDQQKLTRSEGGEKTLRRSTYRTGVGIGWVWVDGTTDACQEKASKKERMISLEHQVEINFDLNLFFKLQSLKTVRTFFKILFSRFFPQKFMASFVLTGWQLS